MRSVPLQSYEQIGAAVFNLKHSENNGITDGVWSINVEDLNRHFETFSSLTSSSLIHTSVGMYVPMPGQPMNTGNKLMVQYFVHKFYYNYVYSVLYTLRM